MSPSKFDDQDQELMRRGVINGPRPSPLRIHKDSHGIQKSSSSSSFVNNLNRKPVIIYTQSPKIIHTQARDFMALVQKLTGLSRPRNKPAKNERQEKSNESLRLVWHEDNNESSSALTDDNCNGCDDVKERLASVSPMFNAPNPYFADIPLFTPNSNDLFFSPRPRFRFSDMLSSSPNMGNSISPSFMEILRGLP